MRHLHIVALDMDTKSSSSFAQLPAISEALARGLDFTMLIHGTAKIGVRDRIIVNERLN